jgi:hypothetical protein
MVNGSDNSMYYFGNQYKEHLKQKNQKNTQNQKIL